MNSKWVYREGKHFHLRTKFCQSELFFGQFFKLFVIVRQCRVLA